MPTKPVTDNWAGISDFDKKKKIGGNVTMLNKNVRTITTNNNNSLLFVTFMYHSGTL